MSFEVRIEAEPVDDARRQAVFDELEKTLPASWAELYGALLPGTVIAKRANVEPIWRDLEVVFRCLLRTVHERAQLGRVVEFFGLPPQYSPLLLDPAAPVFGMVRFDLVPTENGAQITEMECWPDGTFTDELMEEALLRRFPKTCLFDRWRNADVLFDHLRADGVLAPARQVAIVKHAAEALGDDARGFQHALRRIGVEAVVLDGEGLSSRELEHVGLIFRESDYAVFEATNPGFARRVRHIPHWETIGFEYLGNKDLLAHLWAMVDANEVSPEEADSIRARVPRTWHLSRLDPDQVLARRNDLVLKHRRQGRGRNVFVGRATSDADWRKNYELARRDPSEWVVQTSISPTTIDVPLRGTPVNRYHFDFSPHMLWLNGRAVFGRVTSRLTTNEYFNTARSGGYLLYGGVE